MDNYSSNFNFTNSFLSFQQSILCYRKLRVKDILNNQVCNTEETYFQYSIDPNCPNNHPSLRGHIGEDADANNILC